MDKGKILSHSVLITSGAAMGYLVNYIVRPFPYNRKPYLAMILGVASVYGLFLALDMRLWNNTLKKDGSNSDANEKPDQLGNINTDTVIYPVNE